MIGDNIRRLMKERDMTQAQLSKLAHISQSSLSAIINGTSTPKATTLVSVAEHLGVSVEDLERENSGMLHACPRCGSTVLMTWAVASEHRYRVRCGFCELDSGEQKSLEKAIDVMESFRPVAQKSAELANVLLLSDVLDSSVADAENVRPVWFENRGLFVVPALLQCGIAEREQELVRVKWWGEQNARSFSFDKYGSWWRVWSGKPTQGMIDSTPWAE